MNVTECLSGDLRRRPDYSADPEIEAAVTVAEAKWSQDRTDTKPRTRENSKQATVVQMLMRAEGVTVQQITEKRERFGRSAKRNRHQYECAEFRSTREALPLLGLRRYKKARSKSGL